MASKNKVRTNITGNKNDTKVAGGSFRGSSAADSENDVEVIVLGDENKQIVAGSDIEQEPDITLALSELGNLLMAGLKEKNDQEYVQEIINQLKAQVAKPVPERNLSKIKGVLNNLASYVGLAGFAVAQAEKIRILYEQVLKFFS